MSGVRIEVDGHAAALAKLEMAERALADATPLWDQVGRYLELSIQRRFELEQTPAGSKWPPSLRVRDQGGRTLTESGNLLKSITHNAWATGVVAGSNLPYAAIHQFGGTITAKSGKGLFWRYRGKGANRSSVARKQSVTIPARPFLGLSAADEAEIVNIAEMFLGEVLA
jgi:phage virion morphogenesis protein